MILPVSFRLDYLISCGDFVRISDGWATYHDFESTATNSNEIHLILPQFFFSKICLKISLEITSWACETENFHVAFFYSYGARAASQKI